MKRAVLMQMKGEGRLSSLAEGLEAMPPAADNFAMVPLLAQAREEWRRDRSAGARRTPEEARVRLRAISPLSNPFSASFPRAGAVDLRRWQEGLNLEGDPAACLAEFDRRNAEILAQLREGLHRRLTVSPTLFWMVHEPESTFLNGGYSACLAAIVQALGFRAQMALELGRGEVACESVVMALRVVELLGADGMLSSLRARQESYRCLQPTLARGLESGLWRQEQLRMVRETAARLEGLEPFRRTLALENVGIFASFEELRLKERKSLRTWWDKGGAAGWLETRLTAAYAALLPKGWFDANASYVAREGLTLERELDQAPDLKGWAEACDRDEARAELYASGWDYWLRPTLNRRHWRAGEGMKAACGLQTGIRLALVACDLELHREVHGAYPGALEQLQGSPIADPMADGPLRYRRTEYGYRLYSVGEDGRDDGGKRGTAGSFETAADWVW